MVSYIMQLKQQYRTWMHTVKSLNGEAVIKKTISIDTIKIIDGLNVFKLTESKTVETFGFIQRGSSSSNSIQGFVTDNNLENFCQNKKWSTERFYFLSQDEVELIRTNGYHWLFKNDSRTIPESPFDDFLNGSKTVADIVRIDTGNYLISDCNGKPLPVGLYFDYMHGMIDESHYDLVKAADHLMKRGDVMVFSSDEYFSRHKQAKLAKTPKDAVIPIPYYNAEAGRSMHICFVWAPSVSDYEKIIGVVGEKLWSTQLVRTAIFDLDLLGLRAAGIAKTQSYYS
jgi:hypothetical protein